ncbi:MAG: pyrroline-5-carboxylate reductase [Clostridiales Family XIII bacterium]|jgi:pyrroline-5-carboxylate reductase|nr:pyrroline-5-carboxylate reductase [Clostridiales Family XIII bacterium]
MKIGFIGAGNMGGAIIKGYLAAGGGEVFVYDADAAKAAAVAEAGTSADCRGGILPSAKGDNGSTVAVCENVAELVAAADVIVLAVKPNVMEAVLGDVKAADPRAKVFVSIAAGISIGFIRGILGADAKVVRVMPNTPAMVGCGMSALAVAAGGALSDAEKDAVFGLFSSIGEAVWVDEAQMDAVTGISGSSPAYAYMYMEGLIEAGVRHGLSREAATLLAAQSTLGAARMVLAAGGRQDAAPTGSADAQQGPVDVVQLRVNVCSPGGTTIEAVHVLEADGFLETIGKAVDACVAKSKLMTR